MHTLNEKLSPILTRRLAALQRKFAAKLNFLSLSEVNKVYQYVITHPDSELVFDSNGHIANDKEALSLVQNGIFALQKS